MEGISGVNCDAAINCYAPSSACSSIIPYLSDLVIQLGDFEFTIPPAAYTLDQTGSTVRCHIMIAKNTDSDQVSLGIPFLTQFDTEFNQGDSKVLFSKSTRAEEGTTAQCIANCDSHSTKVSDSGDDGMSGGAIFGVILAVFLGIGLIVFLIWYLRKR